MYVLTKRCPQPFSIQLPGRSIHFSDENPTAEISDEEYRAGTVQARLKLRHVSKEKVEGEFPTPDTLQLRQYKARLAANEHSRRRARGEIL